MLCCRTFLIASALLVQAACVIRPLYQAQSTNQNYSIKIHSILERQGQELRNMLLERLPLLSKDSNASLSVSLTNTESGIGYNPDLYATLSRIMITAKVSLTYDKKSVQFESEKSDIVTYPVSTYSAKTNEQDVKQKIMREIANDIILRVQALITQKS